MSRKAWCVWSPACAISRTTSAKRASPACWPQELRAKLFCATGATGSAFTSPPKHVSWLNQIEIWFSILARKLLRRASFRSREHLKARIEAFIDYFNRTLAKPFKWTMTGKPLVA
jgi:hypothetical protein